MTTTAWRLLQQEMHLTRDQAKVFTVLLTGNPIALAGHEALVPLSSLAPDISKGATPGSRVRRGEQVPGGKQELFELLQKMWSVEYPDGSARGFTFATECTLVDNSRFLRYRLNR